MSRSIFLLLLFVNTHLFGASGSRYERSPGARRDYKGFITTVNENTGEFQKPLTTSQALEYAYQMEDGTYGCLVKGCKKPWGRSGRGMTKGGIRDHVIRHMGLGYKCAACDEIFSGYSVCYSHIAKDCDKAAIPPIMQTQVKKEKQAGGAQKALYSKSKSLANLIRAGRTTKGEKRECLECSLAMGSFMAFARGEQYEGHIQSVGHKDIISSFLQRKPIEAYKKLQQLHRELNAEVPSVPFDGFSDTVGSNREEE